MCPSVACRIYEASDGDTDQVHYSLTFPHGHCSVVSDPVCFHLTLDRIHGDEQFCDVKRTTSHKNNNDMVVIEESLDMGVPICKLPPATRICFTVYCSAKKRDDYTKGVRNVQANREVSPI